MASKSEIAQQFNEILSNFLVQISPIVGVTYSIVYDGIVKLLPQLPIQQFSIYMLYYKDKILNRDEELFELNPKVKEITTNNSSTNVFLGELFRLHNIYNKLDKDSKNNVWDIFQALLILSQDYEKN